jgi:hypothetical protein
MLSKKKITVDDLIDAIEQNGLPKTKNQYFSRQYGTSGKITGGCAFGQAALNLGVRPISLDTQTAILSGELRDMIIELNDLTTQSLPEIAQKIRARFGEKFGKSTIMVEECNREEVIVYGAT